MYRDFLNVRTGDPIRAEDMNAMARMAGARGSGPEAIVDHLGVHDLSLPPAVEEKIKFVCESDDVPAYAIMECTGASYSDSGRKLQYIETRKFSEEHPEYTLYINGPTAVTAGDYGYCKTAAERPVFVRALSSSVKAGDPLGPSGDSWTVSYRKFGFLAVGDYTEVTDEDYGIVPVIQDHRDRLILEHSGSQINGDTWLPIPPYGSVWGYEHYSGLVLPEPIAFHDDLYGPYSSGFRQCYVNGTTQLTANDDTENDGYTRGHCYAPVEIARKALADDTLLPAVAVNFVELIGPIPFTTSSTPSDQYDIPDDMQFKCVPHMPGFICDGVWHDGTRWQPLVRRAPASAVYYLKVYGKSGADIIYGYVCNYDGSEVYDGTGDWPAVAVIVDTTFMKTRNSGTSRHRTVNAQVDDIICCNFCDGHFIPCASCWDDPIGTIKFWCGSVAQIPGGWRQYGDAEDYVRIANTAGGSDVFGTTGGGDYAYRDMICIERYQ